MEKIKRYSSLSAKKKDEIFKNTIDLVINTIGLSKGLRDGIRRQIDFDTILHYRNVFDEMIKRQYIFEYKDFKFPLNIKDMKKKMKA